MLRGEEQRRRSTWDTCYFEYVKGGVARSQVRRIEVDKRRIRGKVRCRRDKGRIISACDKEDVRCDMDIRNK